MWTELTTERFFLNAITHADAPRIADLCNDRELSANAGRIPYPYTLEDAQQFVAHASSAFKNGGEYNFAVREDGEFVACVGVVRHGDEWDLGYWVGVLYRGRGIASESAARIVRFAFEDLGASRVTAGHFIDNPASGTILRKIGFKTTGESEKVFSQGRGYEVETVCFALSQKDLQI